MKDRYLILISLAIVIIQTTVLQLFRVMDILPNLMLIWIIIAAVIFDRLTGVKVAVYSGLLTDILIGKGIGINLSIYLLVAIIISSMEEKIFKDNYITPVVLIVMTTVFYHIFFVFVHYFSTGQFLIYPRVFTIILPEVIYNLVIGVFVYIKAFRTYMGYQMR